MKLNSRGLVGEHEFYCCGARVLVKDGEVRVLTEPRISHCPLHEVLYGTKTVDRETIKHSVRMKIEGYGFCCGHRRLEGGLVVPYGSSEIISMCMRRGLLDCAVTVCDGAGTVIADNPDLVQGIGARLTGIIRTSPIRSTIEFIKADGGVVLEEHSARIDQAEGVVKAAEFGHRRIAVTVAGFNSGSIKHIRGCEKERGVQVAVFSVCNTCVDEPDVGRILVGADVVCASASRLIRERVGPKALVQLGLTIPVFAWTRFGKELMLTYLAEFSGGIVAFRSKSMPYLIEGRGPRLKE